MSPKSQVNKGDLCKVTIFLLFGLLISPSFSYATTIIPDLNSGGYFTGDVTWTKAESPYVVTSAIFTNTSSLTIEPGAIVKFNPGYGIQVRGKLVVGSATSTEKVYFTSIKDDTVGGDTNNDATSTLPQAGNWGGLNFAGPVGVAGSIDNAVFRYGGSGGLSAATLIIFGGSINISHSQITDTSGFAIYQSAGSTNVVSSEIKSKCGGIRLMGGTLDITLSSILKDVNSTGWCYFFPYGVDNRTYNPLSAINNWWGTPLGPQHFTNPNGTGNIISGNMNFAPWLTSDPFDTTVCSQNCYSNVLFLPGLMGSRLFEQSSECGLLNGEKELWVSMSNCDQARLAFDDTGKSINPLYTKEGDLGVVDEAYSSNIYKSFMNDLEKWKNNDKLINDYQLIAYDWRLPLEDILNNGAMIGDNISYVTATTSPYIIQELRRLAKNSRTGKVTIVAHSNGGLVTKALTEKLGSEASSLIDKIIFIAVPQVGTPNAVGRILHGEELGPLGFVMSAEQMRTLAKNMPAAYNMVPSTRYFTTSFDPVATFEDKPILTDFRTRYGAEITSATGLKNFITDSWRLASPPPSDLAYPSVGNATLLSLGETTHATLDSWAPPTGVSLYEIAGWGEDTLAGIDYKEGKKAVCNLVQQSFPFTGSYCIYTIVPDIEYAPREVIDGDGTVVVPSALWIATATTTGKWWLDLRKYDQSDFGTTIERKHADILEVPELRALIKNTLTDTILPPFTFITTTEPVANQIGDADKRLSFLLHSPLNLSATDNLGNVISSATSTIPGARFTRYGEVQVLKVPKGTPINLNLDGYATGSFTLDMEELDGLNNIVASTTFSAIPSATSTTATISFPDGILQTATPLLVDYDGNGTTDFTIKSQIGKATIFDIIPPEVRISFSTSTNQLLIEGIDEAGGTTVQTIETSTLISDESFNTIQIIWNKLKLEKQELKLELQNIAYNGISSSTILKTTLQYEWSTDKFGNIKELEQKVTVGVIKVEAHYDAERNVTRVTKKTEESSDGKEAKETFEGLRILKVVTDKGVMSVDY